MINCPYISDCTMITKECHKDYESCVLRQFKEQLETWQREDEEMRLRSKIYKFNQFHDYEQTARINPEGRR